MPVTDEEAADLKTWVVKKLEDISDADSDVLADYVLALIRADTPEAELKVNAIENLEDFLKDNTAAFVDEIFFVIHNKSFLPGHAMPKPEAPSPPFTAPLGPSGAYGQLGGRGGFNGAGQQSRKRSYNDRQEERNGVDAHYNRGDRQMKHPRMGGARGGGADTFGGRGGRGGRPAHQSSGLPGIPSPAAMGFPGLLPPPPGMSFDPNDPMAAMLVMQHAMGFPPLPGVPLPPQAGSPTGFPPFPAQSSPASSAPPKQRINARCRDYDTKGFCTRGNACPFEHGTDLIVVPGQQEGTIMGAQLANPANNSAEYDPKNSVMLDIQRSPSDTNGHTTFDPQRGNDRGRGRGRGRGDRGGPINTFTPRRNRAEFSYAGPINDRSITTIVVEQIPEEKFDEQAVRDFFGDFGEIREVTMQAYKRLALVKYSDWASAKRAYDSPKVIFDNRFVKVYWYKPDSLPTPPGNGPSSPALSKPESPAFDREKFERDAQAAQKKLEEKKALLKDTEAKRQELERQKEELARKQAEETKKLREKLAAKQGKSGAMSPAPDVGANGSNGTSNDAKPSAMTERLRAQLATLEAEAKSLGIDPATTTDDPAWASRGRGRGRARGSYRGWEGFASGRGRGAYDSSSSSRGTSFRGRGSGPYRGRGAGAGAGGMYNLDNRPKKVAVSGVEFDGERDEGLRTYLLGLGEFSHIEPHADGALVVSFKDRYTAEQFMYGGKDIPGVGRVDLAWVSASSAVAGAGRDAGMGVGADAEGAKGGGGAGGVGGETEFDVAEEDEHERWMVE